MFGVQFGVIIESRTSNLVSMDSEALGKRWKSIRGIYSFLPPSCPTNGPREQGLHAFDRNSLGFGDEEKREDTNNFSVYP